MEDLPREMLNEILLWLDKPSLFQASNVCKLWRQQALTHIVSIKDENQLQVAAKNGDWLSIINSVYDSIDWNTYQDFPDGLSVSMISEMLKISVLGDQIAPEEERRNLAKSTISRRYINMGLEGACIGGHKDLAKLMIAKGANNLDRCLQSACQEGHKDLAELMIVSGASEFNWGLRGACRGGYKDLAELMIASGARDFDGGLSSACPEGHKDLVDLMIAKGAKRCHCGKSIEEH